MTRSGLKARAQHMSCTGCCWAAALYRRGDVRVLEHAICLPSRRLKIAAKLRLRTNGASGGEMKQVKLAIWVCLTTLAIATPCSAQLCTGVGPDWLAARATNTLPTRLCVGVPQYKECFTTSTPECERIALIKVRECLAKVPVPPCFDALFGASHYGSKIGVCTALAMNVAMAGSRRRSPTCDKFR